MKRYFYLVIFLFSSFTFLQAQIPNGSIAPDFTAKDINGIEYNLYDILAEGKSVILDFSTTWCGPCWSYHNTGSLHEYMETYGPEGTDESMVFYIESDVETTIDDLEGNTGESQGDWISGTNYPIIDEASIAAKFQIGSYPTIMLVCPDRKVQKLGAMNAEGLHDFAMDCPINDVKPEITFRADNYDGCNSLDVQFIDNSWPRPDNYEWHFGDGEISTEMNPLHTYSSAGSYTVKLSVSNEFGEEEVTKNDYISVGEGDEFATEFMGPADKDIGSGKYFPGGHQALIFDAEADFVLASVKVFSSKEAERAIVLLDKSGNLLNKRVVMIPEGEQVVELNLFVPQGADYQLGLHSDAYMYRNNGGTDYPYSLDELVTITKSTAGTNPLQYYYYFYDWEVRAAGCDNLDNIDNVNASIFELYPNPTYSFVQIETSSKEVPVIYNSLGQIVEVILVESGSGWSIDLSDLNSGMYFVEIGNEVKSVSKI